MKKGAKHKMVFKYKVVVGNISPFAPNIDAMSSLKRIPVIHNKIPESVPKRNVKLNKEEASAFLFWLCKIVNRVAEPIPNNKAKADIRLYTGIAIFKEASPLLPKQAEIKYVSASTYKEIASIPNTLEDTYFIKSCRNVFMYFLLRICMKLYQKEKEKSLFL